MTNLYNSAMNNLVLGDISSISNGIRTFFVDGWGKQLLPALSWGAFTIGLIVIVVGFVIRAFNKQINFPGFGTGFIIMSLGILGIIGFDKVFKLISNFVETVLELFGV